MIPGTLGKIQVFYIIIFGLCNKFAFVKQVCFSQETMVLHEVTYELGCKEQQVSDCVRYDGGESIFEFRVEIKKS